MSLPQEPGVQLPKNFLKGIEILQSKIPETVVLKVQVEGVPGIFSKEVVEKKGFTTPTDAVEDHRFVEFPGEDQSFPWKNPIDLIYKVLVGENNFFKECRGDQD
jgi:hypothetical protein